MTLSAQHNVFAHASQNSASLHSSCLWSSSLPFFLERLKVDCHLNISHPLNSAHGERQTTSQRGKETETERGRDREAANAYFAENEEAWKVKDSKVCRRNSWRDGISIWSGNQCNTWRDEPMRAGDIGGRLYKPIRHIGFRYRF